MKNIIYCQKHFGGSNDDANIVKLTAREHFICHALLVRFLTGQAKYKMAWAFHQLCTWSVVNSCHKETYINSRLYDTFKRDFQCGKNNSQYGTYWWTNLETFEQVRSKTCPGDNYVRGRKKHDIEEKRQQYDEKYEYAKEQGLLRADGRINGNGLTTDEWLLRKYKILNANVDLTKHGWVSKVCKSTGLTKRIIENTVRRFTELQQICFYRKNSKLTNLIGCTSLLNL